jgi:hypothetical protein
MQRAADATAGLAPSVRTTDFRRNSLPVSLQPQYHQDGGYEMKSLKTILLVVGVLATLLDLGLDGAGQRLFPLSVGQLHDQSDALDLSWSDPCRGWGLGDRRLTADEGLASFTGSLD